MSSVENPYQAPPFSFAAQAAAGERADFIAKTYGHLAGAIVVFVALEAVLLNLPGVESLVGLMIGTRYGWLVVLGLFMVVSWIADSWARSAVSTSTQYMGLGLYVVAEAIIFVPLLYIARDDRPDAHSHGRPGHAGAVRRADGRGVRHADRFLVPAVGPDVRRLRGAGR